MPASPRTTAAAPAPLLRRAADYRPQSVQWLWPGRIPLGSITLLAGDPGSGKSLFALDLAARVSTGAPWPDELPPPPPPSPTTDLQSDTTTNYAMSNDPSFVIRHSDSRPSSPGSVLILSATDQFHDTILPRLAAAGADQSRVFVLDHLTNLRAQMDELFDTIDDLPDLKLLVLDPINFYVGPGDAHFQTVVRTILQPLAELAHERGFAILAVTHFRKHDGAALARAAGSMGYVATARAIWTLATDPDDHSRRYLVPLKNNLTAPLAALSFQITDGEMTKDECQMTNEPDANADFVIRHSEIRHSISAPHLTWHPAAAGGLASPKTKRSTLRDQAQRFLEQALADGPRPASKLLHQADARGITRRTLQRAFHELDGHTAKQGLRAGWWWSLGEYPIDPIPDRPDDNPFVQPTYANDVADRLAQDRITDEITARLAQFDQRTIEHEHQSRAVTPSQDPRRKPSTTRQSPLSPSAPLAPANGPIIFRGPGSPSDRPRHPGIPSAPIPIPASLRPPNPLSAFVKFVTHPDRQPNGPRSQDEQRKPKST